MSLPAIKFLLNFARLGFKVEQSHVIYYEQEKHLIPDKIELESNVIKKLQFYLNEIYNKSLFGRSIKSDLRKELEENIFTHNGLTDLAEGINKDEFFEIYYPIDPAFTLLIAITHPAYRRDFNFHFFENPHAQFNTTSEPFVEKRLNRISELRYKLHKKSSSFNDVKNLVETSYKRILLDTKLLYGKYTGDADLMKNQLLKNEALIDSLHPKKQVYQLLDCEDLVTGPENQMYLRKALHFVLADRLEELTNYYDLRSLDIVSLMEDGKLSYELHYLNYLNAFSYDSEIRKLMGNLEFEILEHERDIDDWLLPKKTKGKYLTKKAIEAQYRDGIIDKDYYKEKIKSWENGKRSKTYKNAYNEYQQQVKSSDSALPTVEAFQDLVRLDEAGTGYNISWNKNSKSHKAKDDIIKSIINNGNIEVDFSSREGAFYKKRIKQETFTSYYSLFFKNKPFNEFLDTYGKCLKVLNKVLHKSHQNRELYTLALITKNEKLAERYFQVIDSHSETCFAIEYFIQFNDLFNYDLHPLNFIAKEDFNYISDIQYKEVSNYLKNNNHLFSGDIKKFETLLIKLYKNDISPSTLKTIKSYLYDISHDFRISKDLLLETEGKFRGKHGLKVITLDKSIRETIDSNYIDYQPNNGKNTEQKYIDIKSFSRLFERYLYYHAKDIQNNIIEHLTKHSGIKYFDARWKSELELYEIIESKFKDTKVLMHHSPSWLSPQHLDIFLPKYNIAVEYNGKQHYEPLEIFGGEEGLKKTVKRDKKKAKLCQLNDTNLVTHRYDDSFDETLNYISNLISD